MKNALWVVTFAICSSVCANAQTIADVARKERAAKPPAQNPVSITNSNLRRKPAVITEETKPGETQAAAAATAGTAAPVPAPAPAPAPAQAAVAAPAAADAQAEKGWRDKFDAARTDLRRAENQVAVSQLELNKANSEYLTRSYDPGNRGLTAVAESTQRLENANKAVAAARAKLAQLEDELRRAGAPAGWAR